MGVGITFHDDVHFPREYMAGQTAGLRLQSVGAQPQAQPGREAMAPLSAGIGEHVIGERPDGLAAAKPGS